ncbi:EpsG family protein [Pluralibacter gergoviae]|uniref:EpsG family protein n=1 Tax=Pluralibacter gergoviae TaxID=61647 RepID=UPI0009082998|nr:EpsG family protein [Pluralibacter gergoviae]ELD4270057.1 EpsG family protein [Pluralibacter gergoviae]ELD4275037.1 EpsG family protein [Pluralibacter gergoviae]ELD4316331.1 EpsG family protein [Pluralibacter gergoviae]ELD4341047.1 EpsG family protein [Pluralibacter gergoviae]ELN2738036.1 EpsG family protein [Pluralibacter gergoviae]
MKIQRSLGISLITVIILPIAGYIYSLISINKKNAQTIIYPICIFNFFLALRVPPYQDLYRRYLETYFDFDSSTTLLSVIDKKIDYLYYINTWIFYKLNIPFFVIPALYASLTLLFVYKAYLNIGVLNRIDINNITFKLSTLVIISFVNIIAIATTLRFGFAASIAVYGISCLYFCDKKLKGIIFLVIAVMMHISMLIVIGAVIISKFIKVNKIATVFFCLSACLFSTVIISYLLQRFNFFGLNNYFITGYVESAWGSFRTDFSTLFFLTVQYLILSFLFMSTYKNKNYYNKSFDNFINVFLVVCFSLTISITVFNRFLTVIGMYVLLFRYFSSDSFIKRNSIITIGLLGLFFYNSLFINIYVQRRPFMLGEMWKSYYTTPILNLNYGMEDFNNYLKYLNEDGDWIGHELGK